MLLSSIKILSLHNVQGENITAKMASEASNGALKLSLLAPVQTDKECYEKMSLKFGNHVDTQPEN